MTRARSLLVTVLALAFAGVAVAQCARGPTTSELTIRGFGAAYFEQLRTDSAQDLVEFYGGVCLTGEAAGWTVVADRVTVHGISGDLSVQAPNATLLLQGWTLKANDLRADRRRLTMTGVRLSGDALSGTAVTAAVDLEAGVLELARPELAGASFHVRGSRAELDLQGATITDPVITSCGCPGVPFYDVSGTSAKVDLSAQRVLLHQARLTLGGVAVPLGEDVTLDATTLESLTLPIEVAYLPSDAATDVTGTGLGVTVGPLTLGPGLTAQLGVTGLDADYPLAGVARLNGTTPGASFSFGLASGGLRMTMTSHRAVLPWLDVGFDTRVLPSGDHDALREGKVHVRAHADLPALGGGVALEAFAAASSQTPSTTTVAGARLGVVASGTLASPRAPWGRATLRWQAGATSYPDQHASQWGAEVEPGFRTTLGPVALRASYLARVTDGGSPFTTTLDRLEPAQRASLQVALRTGPADGWTTLSHLTVRYDLIGSGTVDAGLNTLHAAATVSKALGSWRLELGGEAALEGVLEPNGVRDGYLQASLTARESRLAFTALARYRFAPGPQGLDRLELSAAVPLAFPGVDVRPYLAIDLTPTLDAGLLPAVSGHGLDFTFVTCCGTLELGYRDQDGVWSVSAAVDLQHKTSVATAACPTTVTSDVTAVATPAPTCSVAPDGAGIMAGAVSGSSPP